MLARHLRRNKTNTLLVMIEDISNSFFSGVFQGIEAVASNNGYHVLVGNTDHKIDRVYEYFERLPQRQVDGMILLVGELDRRVTEEVARQYPIVLASEYLEGSDIPTVSIDNISSARKATEHLISLGHSRIAHISGPLKFTQSLDRLKGFSQAMDRHELQLEHVLIQEGDFSFSSGYNLMKKLLALESPPTAVFAAGDAMAIGAIKAAKEYGLCVPEDLAVVGFDGLFISSIYEPALTTIQQPVYEIGQRAMELLMQLMNEKNIKKRQIILEDELIIRDSCGFNRKNK
jgi:LacI family repressor for deo operon, udp, cdd, tsx, nupC, and nupG